MQTFDAREEAPLTAEERGFLDAKDAEDNRTTAPPADERVRLPCLWVIEAFTPATIRGLEDGAQRLGWDASGYALNRDFLSQVGDLRTSPGGSAWLNLGLVGPQDSTSKWRLDRRAPLPEGIDTIRPMIFQPFPSTTFLCCQFELDDRLANCLEAPLHDSYATRKERTGRESYVYWNVEHLKERQVQVARAAVRTICTGWVADFFPGHFASLADNREPPTFELILFALHEDFAFRSIQREPEYLRIVGCQNSGENWVCEKIENLYMRLEGRSEAPRVTTLFGNVAAIGAGTDMTGYGPGKEGQLINWLGHNLDRTLSTLAMNHLVDNVIAQLGRERDEFGASNPSTDSEALWRLEERLSALQRSALPLVSDLRAYCKRDWLFLSNVFEFVSEHSFRGERSRLFAGLRKYIRRKARLIGELAKQLQAIALQAGRILAARASDRVAETNIKLQRWMLWLTIIVGVFTAVSSIEPIKKLLE